MGARSEYVKNLLSWRQVDKCNFNSWFRLLEENQLFMLIIIQVDQIIISLHVTLSAVFLRKLYVD